MRDQPTAQIPFPHVEFTDKKGQPIEDVRDRLGRAGQISAVRSDVRKRKALEWLLERTEVLDPDGAAIDRSELELPADDEDDAVSVDDEPAQEEAQADA